VRALITRPLGDAEMLAEALRVRGVDSAIAPMLSIETLPGVELDIADAQAVLLTSSNGARALAEATDDRSVRIYAVGDSTARVARNMKFFRVESAGGDVDDLARLVSQRLDPADGPLLHAAGQVVARDLTSIMINAGFTLRRVVLYSAIPATEMPGTASAALSAGTIDAVLFFSPRTAETFVSLAKKAGLESHCGEVSALCLSQPVADAASKLSWRSVDVAERANQAQLLRLMDKIATGGGRKA
jgi:uroporphyrinogen-III synthase